jgi:hypothetical protein
MTEWMLCGGAWRVMGYEELQQRYPRVAITSRSLTGRYSYATSFIYFWDISKTHMDAAAALKDKRRTMIVPHLSCAY